MTKAIGQLWQRHRAWLKQHLPDSDASLFPPVTEAQLARFREQAGYELPEPLKQLYLLNDGQDPNCLQGVWWGLPFLPLDELLQHHLPKAPPTDMSAEDTSFPAGAVQLYDHSPKWVPFAHDGAFNHIALDLDPGPRGTLGQVINCGRDERHKCVLAESLEEFMRFMVDEIARGGYVLADDGCGGVTFGYRSAHLLDDLVRARGEPSKGRSDERRT